MKNFRERRAQINFPDLEGLALKKLFRMLRFTIFIFFLSLMQVMAVDSYAQMTKLSLSVENESLEKVLGTIEDESEFFFLYNKDLIDVEQEVSVDAQNETIKAILDGLLEGKDIAYTVYDRQIVLSNIEVISEMVAQQNSISGTVTDETGESLPGVTVIIKGTTNGTVTNMDGEYTISNFPAGATLQFSFVGMLTQEITVGTQKSINITMAVDAIGIEEVVAVGYGVQKKSDVIGSVISVKPESAVKVPSTDLGEMLRGKAPGVFVTLGDAGPGSSSNILIRGKNSINGGNNPIVIADGVPVGDINDVNPNDIASIEILKDASAQAIYGARASNGVILITTKRAKDGKARLDVNAYFGMQTIRDHFDLYSGEEMAQLIRESYRTDNNGEYLPDTEIFSSIEQDVLQSGEFVDWQKEVLRVAPIQNYNLSLSSGTKGTKVYSGFNYTNQEGVVPGTDYQKASIRINVDQTITDWIKFGTNASFQISQKNDPGTGFTLNRIVTASPLGKVYNEDGTYRFHPTGLQTSENPLLDLKETTNLKNNQNLLLNFFVDINIVEGLSYRFNASRRSSKDNYKSYSTTKSISGINSGGLGEGSIFFRDQMEWQIENILNFNKKIENHNLGLTFVQSVSQSKYDEFNNSSDDFPNDILGIYGLETAAYHTPSIIASKRALTSFVGRMQYDYVGKYYLTLSSRVDGSSVFGANNKWGFFPAAAIGWNVYREDFMEKYSNITNLKIRASYGSVGNEAIAPYQSLSIADQRDYIFNGFKRTGYVPGTYLPNPNLKWETSTTLNGAIDFGFWKNRLSGTIELYNTRTKDLLVDRILNAGSGYTRMKSNIGEIENKGVEFALNSVVVDNKDWTINAGISFSRNRNKIIRLYGEDSDGDGKEDDDIGNNWFIGYPIDVYYDYKPIGIFQLDDDIANSHQDYASPGDVKVFDRYPDDGQVNGDDRVITETDPDWFGSFNFDMKYKNLDFAFDILTVQGVIRDNPYLYAYNFGGSLRGIFNGIKQDYWTPENTTGDWPRPSESSESKFIENLGLQDASYIRLQTVTLGYTLPKLMLKKVNFSNARVYFTAHNLLTFTDYESYSPEKDARQYPEAVSLVVGVQLSF